MEHLMVTVADILKFMFAGNAYFTLQSPSSVRYTYRVSRSKKAAKEGKDLYFVSLLTGPQNTSDYTYIGLATKEQGFRLTQASKMNADSVPVRAIVWTTSMLLQGKELGEVKFWHEGKCGRCGRKLTVPESIANGIGPECAGKM